MGPTPLADEYQLATPTDEEMEIAAAAIAEQEQQ